MHVLNATQLRLRRRQLPNIVIMNSISSLQNFNLGVFAGCFCFLAAASCFLFVIVGALSLSMLILIVPAAQICITIAKYSAIKVEKEHLRISKQFECCMFLAKRAKLECFQACTSF